MHRFEMHLRRAANFLDGKKIVLDKKIISADAINLIGSLEEKSSLFLDGSLRFRAFWDKPTLSVAVGLSPQEAKKCVESVFKNDYCKEGVMQVYADSGKNRFVYLDMPLPENEKYGFTISFKQEAERVPLDLLGCTRSLRLIRKEDLIEGIDIDVVDRNGKEESYLNQTPIQAIERVSSPEVVPLMTFEERLIGARIFLNDFIRKRHEAHVSLSGNGSYPVRVEMRYVQRLEAK